MKAVSLRDPIDERPKADALDAAAETPGSRLHATSGFGRHRFAQRQHLAPAGLRTPLDHQMRQAPSSDTMHGPIGVRGVQARP